MQPLQLMISLDVYDMQHIMAAVRCLLSESIYYSLPAQRAENALWQASQQTQAAVSHDH